MRNFVKKNLTLRKGFITGVFLLILFNICFIGIYYRLYLNEKINNRYAEITKEVEKDVEKITTDLNENPDIDAYLTQYVSNNKNISIVLKDSNNQTITEYKSNTRKKNNITVSSIVKSNDKYYLLNITEYVDIFNFHILIHFLVFELISILILATTGILGANKKILSPLTRLSKDFSNYKLGILPRKRKVFGGVDIIQNDFVDLVTELEEEKQKQNRIIASISHDIKTPLTSILGYSELLLTSDTLSDKTKNKYINTIHNKSLVMKEIVEEFDDYLSCNIKNPNKVEVISISHLIDYLNDYYKEDLNSKNIEFKVKSNCPNVLISVDLSKFKRIFSNTITNSIRHLEKERKILNININEQKNGKIRFEIADNGTGCKEDLQKIFEPLYTTDKSRKISGLGLSICKEIVESHNGTIKAENNNLGGFSIIFTIDAYKENQV